MADLSEKVAQEQQQFVKAQYLDAPDAERYRYMDPRVEAQLQVSSWASHHPRNLSALMHPTCVTSEAG